LVESSFNPNSKWGKSGLKTPALNKGKTSYKKVKSETFLTTLNPTGLV